MTTTTTKEDLGDANGLLQYDPGLVVAGQLHNRDVLDRLLSFAFKLTRCVENAKECHQPRDDEHNAIDLLAGAKVKQEEEETVEVEVDPPPKANVSNESLKVVSEKRHYRKMDGKKEAYDSESESAADTLKARREEDAAEPSPKRQRLEVSKTTQPAILSTELGPPDGYGTLSESKLERSVGLTRKTLNLHLRELGLTAKFLTGAVSKTGGRVSHLTLSSEYGKLPYSFHQKLQMWLGVGPLRRKLAIPLSPDSNPQQPAIPIFWAEKHGPGAPLCYYFGHFRCVKFEDFDEIVVRMKIERQALLEFEFVDFDDNMANKLAKIAVQRN